MRTAERSTLRARIAAMMMCSLGAGLLPSTEPAPMKPPSPAHRQVVVTFDDLPTVSVRPDDADERRNVTQRLRTGAEIRLDSGPDL